MTIEDRGVVQVSNSLENRTIALGVSGGIGSVEVVKIIRELRRHGAKVKAFMTPSALEFLTAKSVQWASLEPPILETTGHADHLANYDMVVVAPCTWNTMVGCAIGEASTVVTLLVASQISKCPLLLVPTMNSALHQHPLWEEYFKRLSSWGVKFLTHEHEGRLKMPEPQKLVDEVLSQLRPMKSDLV